jgi:hypothetical protein
LQYTAGRWYAQRSGQTRIVIDDLELGGAPVLLNEVQRVRFYRATETDVYRRPLGSVDLLLGSRQSGRADIALPDGNFLVPVALGNERGTYFLNASDHLTIRQVGAALLHHSGQTLENVTAYSLRLLSPSLPLEQVLREGTFFYARNEGSLARYLLLLKDVNRPERRYQLAAGQGSERKLVGWHGSSQSVLVALDLDLSESLIPHLEPATASSPVKAYIHFSPVDQSWSIRAEEAGKTGVFVNHARVGAVPQRLTKGDVILFGLTPTQSYARLQVDLRSEHNQN